MGWVTPYPQAPKAKKRENVFARCVCTGSRKHVFTGGIKMREIKYRAWNKELGEMWIGGYVQFDTGNIWFDNEDGDMFEYTQAEFPLMQYTGLKDKNGKEIYEEDILNDKRNKRRKYKVVFDDGALFCVSLSDGILPEGFNMHRLTKQNVRRLHEVIGNIYENPDLLIVKNSENL